MSIWLMIQSILLAFYGYIVFQFCNRFLETRILPKYAVGAIIIYKVFFNYLLLYKLLDINYYFSIFISQLGLMILILLLFQGSFAKKLAFATVIYVIQELTACAVVPLLTRCGDLIADYIFHAALPMLIIYSIWTLQYIINCLIIRKLSLSCTNLRVNFTNKTSIFLIMPSLFILAALEFASYLCNDRQISLIFYSLKSEPVSPLLYQLTDPVILFLLSVLGLAANLIIVFGTNDAMLQLLKEQQLSMQIEHYETLQRQSQQLHKVRHDLKNHIISMEGLLEENKVEEAKDYLCEIGKTGNLTEMLIKTGNHTADAILNAKYKEALKNQIEFHYDINLPAVKMNDFDLCIILGNAIDNAIEACNRITSPYQKKFVSIQSGVVKTYFIIEIKNSAENNDVNPKLLKTKKYDSENHGIGLKNIKETVKKYQGLVDVTISPECFCLSIMLPR